MFGLAYLTVLASKEDSTLSWAFANTLMVLLAKLAEQSLGPSWAAVPAVSVVTWQVRGIRNLAPILCISLRWPRLYSFGFLYHVPLIWVTRKANPVRVTFA